MLQTQNDLSPVNYENYSKYSKQLNSIAIANFLFVPDTSPFFSSDTKTCSNPELLIFPFPLEYKPNQSCFRKSRCFAGSGGTLPKKRIIFKLFCYPCILVSSRIIFVKIFGIRWIQNYKRRENMLLTTYEITFFLEEIH